MTLLIIQLALLLLAAAGVGLFTGWQLQRSRAEARLIAQASTASRRVGEARTEAESAQAELDEANRLLGGLKADHKQATRRLRNLTGGLSDSESTIAGLEADTGALRQKNTLLSETNTELEARLAEAAASHAAQQQRIEQKLSEALADADSLRDVSQQHELALAELQTASDKNLAQLKATVAKSEQDCVALRTTLDTQTTELDRLRAVVKDREASIADLRDTISAGVREAHALGDKISQARQDGVKLNAELLATREKRDKLANQVAQHAKSQANHTERLAAMDVAYENQQHEAHRAQAEIEMLRPELEASLSARSNSRDQVASAERNEQSLRDEVALLRQRVSELAASRTTGDDLQRIRGIGPVLERALRENGITRFSQIAEFTDADIERLSEALQTFPDRVRRDQWVEQARELAGS